MFGADLDEAVMASLSDGVGEHLSAAGQVLVGGLELILDRNVERFQIDSVSGAMERATTLTVRKALQNLVEQGVLIQRHGSGTFVAPRVERVEQSLSRLTSFTEDMARRGKQVHSVWLERGVYVPSPQETMVLGLTVVVASADESRGAVLFLAK